MFMKPHEVSMRYEDEGRGLDTYLSRYPGRHGQITTAGVAVVVKVRTGCGAPTMRTHASNAWTNFPASFREPRLRTPRDTLA